MHLIPGYTALILDLTDIKLILQEFDPEALQMQPLAHEGPLPVSAHSGTEYFDAM